MGANVQAAQLGAAPPIHWPRLLSGLIAAMLMASVWAISSPVGSAADDAFHLSGIWCAWGESDACRTDPNTQTQLVPEAVGATACYALTGNSGQCVAERGNGWLVNQFVAGYNPPLFYASMRAFVTQDVDLSVLLMRLGNVILVAGLWLLAFVTGGVAVRRALVVGWFVGLVPVSIFFIPSTNPSAWAIGSAGLFWAFYYTLRTARSMWSRRFLSALAGGILVVAMGLGSRSDTVYALIASVIAVEVLLARPVRLPLRRLLTGAGIGTVLIGLAIVYISNTRASFFVSSLTNNVGVPSSGEADQPNALLKFLLELPSFAAALVGGQSTVWSQRTSALDAEAPGYSYLGFTYGVGHTDVFLPSIVAVLLVAATGAFLLVSLRNGGRRSALVLAFLSLSWIAQSALVRSAFAFGPFNLQPRYFAPLFLASLCLFALWEKPKYLPNRVQRTAAVVGVAIAGSIALAAVIGRYAQGQGTTFLQLNDEPRWQWTSALAPGTLWVVGSAAAVVLAFAVAWFGKADSGSPAAPDRAPAPLQEEPIMQLAEGTAEAVR